MIILRTKRYTYIGRTGKDEYTHLLGEIRDEIYNHPEILKKISEDAENLGYPVDDFIREMSLISRKHTSFDKILLEIKHSRSDKTLIGCLSDDNNVSLIQYEEVSQQRSYSGNRGMIDRIIKKLDTLDLGDYDISTKIPKDSISISSDLGDLKIFLPLDFEYSQYDIDDFVRSLGHFKTKTIEDGNFYIMTILGGRLTETQYFKLARFILEENEFITFLENR